MTSRGAKLPKGINAAEAALMNKGFLIDFFHIPTGKSVQFKAMVTQFDDKYDSSWNDEEVYGRMDPISTFKGTKRTITLAWDVVASSLAEASANLANVSLLISMLYPSYHVEQGGEFDNNFGSATLSASPLFRLSFMNLASGYVTQPGTATPKQSAALSEARKNLESLHTEIDLEDPNFSIRGGDIRQEERSIAKRQLEMVQQQIASSKGTTSGLVGKMSGLSYSPKLDDGFFVSGGSLMAQNINLSCTYTVIHTTPLGWSHGEFRTKNFPYGASQAPSKERNKEQGGGGTARQRSAKRKKILK